MGSQTQSILGACAALPKLRHYVAVAAGYRRLIQPPRQSASERRAAIATRKSL
ncbi:MAG: hypothetical protein ACLQGU_03530 [bacterium]